MSVPAEREPDWDQIRAALRPWGGAIGALMLCDEHLRLQLLEQQAQIATQQAEIAELQRQVAELRRPIGARLVRE